MDNSLAIKITHGSLMKYALPTILSNLFMNVYSLVDSLFVSNLIGIDALSAVNIVGPALAITLAIGTMIATGGCALVSKQMGEGKLQEARQNFSFFLLFCTAVSTAFTLFGILFRHPILSLMGADEMLFPLCEAYAIPIFLIIPFAMIGILLQIFFVAAGQPGLAFMLSIVGGVLNIVLDYVLIAVVPLNVVGAAIATGVGYVFQSLVGLGYFALNRRGSLYLVKPKFDGKTLLKACSNGMSEMVSMLAVSITMVVTNVILMNLVGSNGVAAAAIVLSVQTILSAVYMGYSQGIAPIISFNYGKDDYDNLKKLYRYALHTIAVMSVITFLITFLLAKPIALIFADGSEEVIEMAVTGTFVFAGAFLLMGVNLFASSMFTALNDGVTSGILSFFRTLVFLIVPLLIFPYFWGIMGVWISLPTAEVLSFLLALFYFKRKKAIYHYA